jgi:hypothetical protein
MTNSPFFPSSNFAEWSQLNRTDDHTPAKRTANGRIEGRADSLGEWSGWWGGANLEQGAFVVQSAG